MSKLNEAALTSSIPEGEKKAEKDEEKERSVIVSLNSSSEKKITKTEDDQKDILKFTMLFNKYNSDLDVKRSPRHCEDDEKHKKDVKRAMFFNKEVTIRFPSELAKNCTDSTKPSTPYCKPSPFRIIRNKSKFCSHKSETEFGKPQFSEPDMMFSDSLTSSTEVFGWKPATKKQTENLKKFFNKKNTKTQNDSLARLSSHVPNLRIHSSLTSLHKNNKLGIKGVLKSKIPSLTAIDANSLEKASFTRINYWDCWDNLFLMQNDIERRLSLQISRSSNDNNCRSWSKFKKEDAASVSDSKLLYSDFESKKHFKKCDKKSRGDSSKKEKDLGSRKQVQWKTEVDVIYFSTHLATNGDRTGEVIGRVMEPLREEWEQQRKGFYAKMFSDLRHYSSKQKPFQFLKKSETSKGQNLKPQSQCRVCAAYKISCYMCEFCKVSLHRGDCFFKYQTLRCTDPE